MSTRFSIRSSEPQKLLPAPRIAGLLPARAESLRGSQDADSANFMYQNARLSEVPFPQQERLAKATTNLLDVAVAFALGELNEAALRAAEVVFHRAIAGRSPVQARNPAEYCAEMDADVLDWFQTASKSLVTARGDAIRELMTRRQRTQ